MNSSPAGVFTVYLCQDAISEDSPNRYGQKTGGSKKLKSAKQAVCGKTDCWSAILSGQPIIERTGEAGMARQAVFSPCAAAA